jgi:hypothetical protein
MVFGAEISSRRERATGWLLFLTTMALAAGCGGGHGATTNDGGGGLATGGAGTGSGGSPAGSSGGSAGTGSGAGGSGATSDGGSTGTGGRLASGPWVALPATNNAATLTGVSIGDCPSSSDVRRKKIPLIIDGGSGDFQIGDAYLLAEPGYSSLARLVAPVKNVGTTLHCAIGAPINGYDWLDANGHSMNVTVGPGFIGSEGDVGMPTYDETCLQPGETGFILDEQEMEDIVDLYDAVSAVTLALVSKSTGTTPAAVVVPQSYTYSATGTVASEVQVIFDNVGTGAAEIADLDYGAYLVLDAGGLPVWVGRLYDLPDGSTVDNPGLFAAGTAGLGYDPQPQSSAGCGTSLRAFIKFEGPTAPYQQ